MALYEYRCDMHGAFDLMRPLGRAAAEEACPTCGAPSRRVFSAPMLLTGARSAWTAARDRAEKSRYEPEVVGALPPTRPASRRAPLDPALSTLPRP